MTSNKRFPSGFEIEPEPPSPSPVNLPIWISVAVFIGLTSLVIWYGRNIDPCASWLPKHGGEPCNFSAAGVLIIAFAIWFVVAIAIELYRRSFLLTSAQRDADDKEFKKFLDGALLYEALRSVISPAGKRGLTAGALAEVLVILLVDFVVRPITGTVSIFLAYTITALVGAVVGYFVAPRGLNTQQGFLGSTLAFLLASSAVRLALTILFAYLAYQRLPPDVLLYVTQPLLWDFAVGNLPQILTNAAFLCAGWLIAGFICRKGSRK